MSTDEVNLGKMLNPEPVVISRGDHWEAATAILKRFRDDQGEAGLVWTRGDWWKADHLQVWRKRSEEYIRQEVLLLKKTAFWHGVPGEAPRSVQMTASYMRAVYDIMKVVASVEEFFDSPSQGLAFQNGFLEPGKTELRPLSRLDRVQSTLPWDWDPTATCEPFLRFLEQIWGPDGDEDRDEKIKFFREWLGETLARRSTKHRKVVLLHGKGRNGKSILADVVDGIFARDSVASIPPQYFSQAEKIGSLAQATINIVPDIPNRAIKDTGNFKAVVTGDPVMGRFLYGNPFSFRAECGHFFSCNDLPRTSDHTEGFFSRMVVLGFHAAFGNKPGDLPARPKDELLGELRACTPGIIRWAVEGSLDVVKRGYLFTPESSERVLRGWREDMDTVQAFLNECVDLDVNIARTQQGTSCKVMFSRYRAWCEECGETALTRSMFDRRLKSEGVRRLDRVMHKGVRDFYWYAKLREG